MQEIAKLISEKFVEKVPEENVKKLPKKGLEDEKSEIYVTRLKGEVIVKVCVYDDGMIYFSSH